MYIGNSCDNHLQSTVVSSSPEYALSYYEQK